MVWLFCLPLTGKVYLKGKQNYIKIFELSNVI